jgi:hypothetical protein
VISATPGTRTHLASGVISRLPDLAGQSENRVLDVFGDGHAHRLVKAPARAGQPGLEAGPATALQPVREVAALPQFRDRQANARPSCPTPGAGTRCACSLAPGCARHSRRRRPRRLRRPPAPRRTSAPSSAAGRGWPGRAAPPASRDIDTGSCGHRGLLLIEIFGRNSMRITRWPSARHNATLTSAKPATTSADATGGEATATRGARYGIELTFYLPSLLGLARWPMHSDQLRA